MNKFSIMAKSVTIAMSMVGIAYADHSWTGFYAGANAGVIFNNTQLRSQQLGFTNPSEDCNSSSNFSTFSPGIQLGYLYQSARRLILGVEASASFNTHQKETLSCRCPDNLDVSDRFTFRNQMQNAVKGRLGLALNWNENMFLPYVTTGGSFANIALKYQNEGGDYYSDQHTKAGWLIGAGLEWVLSQSWSLRAEYAYVNYGNVIKLKIPTVYGLEDPDGKAQVDLNTNNVVISINYKTGSSLET